MLNYIINEKKEAEILQQKLKEHLEELNKLKSRFFSIVSHDLRGPFNNLIALVDMLEEFIRGREIEKMDQVMLHLK